MPLKAKKDFPRCRDMYDLIIKGGLLIDPYQGIMEKMDVAISDGKVSALEPHISASEGRHLVDASGQIVTPGLIDLHTHVCHGITYLSVDPEASCLPRGSTTVVDAGTIGELLFEGFRRFIIDASRSRIYAFLNVGSLGLIYYFRKQEWAKLIPEPSMTPLFINLEDAARTVEANRDVILGIKWHSTYGLDPALRLARELADRTGCLLMCENHHQPIVLRQLKPGDIVTHVFHGLHSQGLLDEDGKVRQEFYEAIKKGVILDVGHGVASFSWEVAERAMEQGIKPDTISTDLHIRNVNGPVFDLPTTLSKFLLLGLTLEEVIRAATAKPAEVLGKAGILGTLKPGAEGDAVVFRLEEGRFSFIDTKGVQRIGKTRLIPTVTVRGGFCA
jgi:dihydroorotase